MLRCNCAFALACTLILTVILPLYDAQMISTVSNINLCEQDHVFINIVADLPVCEDGVHVFYLDNGLQLLRLHANLSGHLNECAVTLQTGEKAIALDINDSEKFKVRVYLFPDYFLPIYSNDFTIKVQGPPDPVGTIVPTVNCSTVYLSWTPVSSSSDFPVLFYTLFIPDTNITNITSSTDISYDISQLSVEREQVTVVITATNRCGTSNATNTMFTTAIVRVVDRNVSIISQPEANFAITVQCIFSYLIITVSCDDEGGQFSITQSDVCTDGFITQEILLPTDLLHCFAQLTVTCGLNVNSSKEYQFSTSAVQEVFIANETTTGYFTVNCTLLPGGSGCVIEVYNASQFFIFSQSFPRTTSTRNYVVDNSTHQLTTNGTYKINIYSLKGEVRSNITVATKEIEVMLPPYAVNHHGIDLILIAISTNAVTLVVIFLFAFVIVYNLIKHRNHNRSRSMWPNDGLHLITFTDIPDSADDSFMSDTCTPKPLHESPANSCNSDLVLESDVIPPSEGLLEKILGAFDKLVKLPVDSSGLIHHCSQYGVTLIIPEGAVVQPATVWFAVSLFSEKFRFEAGCVPVTPIVWVYIDQKLLKPAELYIPHHIDVSNMAVKKQLFLMSCDDGCCVEDIFKFTKNLEFEVTIDCQFSKLLCHHFCSNSIVVDQEVYVSIPKRYMTVMARKQVDSRTILVEFCLFLCQTCCFEKVKEQYLKNEFVLSNPESIGLRQDGCISVTFDPDDIAEWKREHNGFYTDQIMEWNIDYYTVMGCRNGTVTQDNIKYLKCLEDTFCYPPRFRFMFCGTNTALATQVQATFQGLTQPLNVDFILKRSDDNESQTLSSITAPTDRDMTLKSDEIMISMLTILPNVGKRMEERWFVFGIALGLSMYQLHQIELKYSTPQQYVREVLLLWRYNNRSASQEPIANALIKVGLTEIASRVQQHSTMTSSTQTHQSSETDLLKEHILTESDLGGIMERIESVATHYEKLGQLFHIPQYRIYEITREHNMHLRKALNSIVHEWLMCNFDRTTDDGDLPNRRWLVKAVGKINYALATRLETEYSIH